MAANAHLKSSHYSVSSQFLNIEEQQQLKRKKLRVSKKIHNSVKLLSPANKTVWLQICAYANINKCYSKLTGCSRITETRFINILLIHHLQMWCFIFPISVSKYIAVLKAPTSKKSEKPCAESYSVSASHVLQSENLSCLHFLLWKLETKTSSLYFTSTNPPYI